MEKRSIYILLSHTGSVISHMIKKFSELEYSHISVGIDDTFKTFYSFGRRRPSNPLIAGFVSESVKDGVYTRFDNAKYALYKLDITPLQYSKFIEQLAYFEENKKAYKYNFVGLISAKAGYSLDRKNAYFCSQFAAKLFESADIFQFDKKYGLITPMDFKEIPDIELIHDGVLKDFREFQWDIVTEQKSFDVMRFPKYCFSRIRGL